MNVKELREALAAYPDDMKVVVYYHSDYVVLESSGLETKQGVDQNGYVMEPHPTMSADNKAREASFLLIGP